MITTFVRPALAGLSTIGVRYIMGLLYSQGLTPFLSYLIDPPVP